MNLKPYFFGLLSLTAIVSCDTDSLELLDRYNFLMEKYVILSDELAKKLEEFGRIKNELEIIFDEY